MQNKCQATGCTNTCNPKQPMCTECWALVSVATRKLAYKVYTPGQQAKESLIKPAWKAALRTAIREVDAHRNIQPLSTEISPGVSDEVLAEGLADIFIAESPRSIFVDEQDNIREDLLEPLYKKCISRCKVMRTQC